MLNNLWVQQFEVSQDDIDFITNLMLENEKPMLTSEVALVMIERRLEKVIEEQANQYANTRVYNPTLSYDVGDKLVFTAMDNVVGVVTGVREGHNPEHGDFKVMDVQFEADDVVNKREFACELASHALGEVVTENTLASEDTPNAREILRASHAIIMPRLIETLQKADSLVRVGSAWFVGDLVMETDIGSLHLAEAVLDMNGGGPLSSEEIVEQIGGLGDAPMTLQAFSIDLALNNDDRFDEVGTSGKIMWYLNRMAPEYVRSMPTVLQYSEIDYDEDILTDEMIDLETELDDELSPIDFEGNLRKATATLLYPHRRAGTLPLNAKMRQIFPKAKTPRIYVELIDTTDDSRFGGWVVHEFKYVYGLLDYYTKHQLPIGTLLTVKKGEHPGQILLGYDGHKARNEWVRVVTPTIDRIGFDIRKRQIGAEFDELVLVGVDDLERADKLSEVMKMKPLSTLLKMVVGELSKLTPQGTAHATTIYSSVNIFRRCPPAPIFATLQSHPDFTYAGDHYWRLSD